MKRGTKIKSWDKPPVALHIVTFCALLFLVLPILIVVPMSFNGENVLRFPPTDFSLKWYEVFFSSSKWINATLVSIKIALGVTGLSCAVGILASIGLSQKIMRGSRGLKLLLMAPIMLPSVIVAISMYLVFGQWKIVGTFSAIVLAHTCLALPFVVTLISASLSGLDPRLYDAARSLGAGHFTAIVKVVLPLIKPAIFSSMLFSFITSFDESVLVLFITKTKTLTLPRMIYAELRYSISPALAAVSSLLIFVTLFLFIFSRVLANMNPETAALRSAEKANGKAMRLGEKGVKIC
ncbi:MAG: ABC transporter permease [Clostridiales Family XIII bacterium]|jgi:putative spermidine/putrescine transport system permease protein|nr:ABC transporter permease [Clostridiales Family XIII bacterium]